MTLPDLLNALTSNTIGSLALFRTELALCLSILAMLLVRICNADRWIRAYHIAFAGSLLGLWFAVAPFLAAESLPARTELFTGLLVYDRLTLYFRSVLLIALFLIVVLTRLSGIPDREDGPDFYSLLFGATLGMCLMASANHLLMIFLAVEMASVPSYVLAGILKGRRSSSEAALKYVVYGGASAGIMLYGLSLLAAVLGSCHLPTMAHQLGSILANPEMADRTMVLVLAGLMVSAGVAFKLSAFPFHFWCPDVFEGASAEVGAFLSVSSKAAALALLIRLSLGFVYVPAAISYPVAGNTEVTAATSATGVAEQALAEQTSVQIQAVQIETAQPIEQVAILPLVAEVQAVSPAETTADGLSDTAFAPARNFLVLILSLVAAVTCTFGNFAAFGQTNIKRLLAYSSIAHAGYMMMPVAAAIALLGGHALAAERALAGAAFYLFLYLFMNLGAFAIIAFLRNELRSENIADYSGLVRTNPGIAICFSIILVGLIGIPPLAGFAGKWAIFAAVYTAIQASPLAPVLWCLLVVGGLNTAVSLFYYLNLVRIMTMAPVPEDQVPVEVPLVSLRGAYIVALTLPVALFGVFWNSLYTVALRATQHLLH